jgi:arylsulfatase A-like enzyme
MTTEMNLFTHVRTALTAVLLLVLCQIVLETMTIAIVVRQFVLSPYTFFATQMYDFCVKLFFLLPGAAEWLRGGALDRFLPEGFYPKLVLGGGLILPNLAVGGVLGLLVGGIRYAGRRPAQLRPALWTVVTFGFVVHLVSLMSAVRLPKAWSAEILARNLGRVFVWDGVWMALLVLVIASVLAAGATRLAPVLRWAVSLAIATGLAVTWLTLSPAPASLSKTVREASGGQNVAAALPPKRAQINNVLLISIDSLRADRLGSYGNDRSTSPTLDRLAREGARFARAMSTTSWTLPAHMSLLTGRYVLSHGVVDQTDRLSAAVPTLTESLHQSGLTTAGIVSMLFLGTQYGFSRGFDVYDDHTIPSVTEYGALHDEPASVLTDLATTWLRTQGERRFFLFLHFWDVHYDYVPPAPYDSMFDPDYTGRLTGTNFLSNPDVKSSMPRRDLEHIMALYDGEIRWVDDQIARLLAVLDEIGVSDTTAVIVTADHGDEFFEHGGKGHRRTLYREVVHIPLIMRVPGYDPGRVVDAPVSLVDVMPTVLELTGAAMPPGMDGVSLVPTLAGGSPPARESIYAELCRKQKMNCEVMQYSAAGTLFHMFEPLRLEFFKAADFLQRENIARSSAWPRHQQMALLSDSLNFRWRAYRSLGKHEKVKLDRASLERLRALGYAD